MTGLEAIPKIGVALKELYGVFKDSKTSALVSQIQGLFHDLHADYAQIREDRLQAEKNAFHEAQAHAKAIKELEAKNADTVAQLNAKLEELKSGHATQVAALQQEMAAAQLQNLQLRHASNDLTPDKVKVLQALVDGEETPTREIMRRTGFSKPVVLMVMSWLDDADMVTVLIQMGDDPDWVIAPKGTQYLYDRGLVQ